MLRDSLVYLFALVVYVSSLAAEAVLLGTSSLSGDVGLPLLSSTVTLGLGAALALVRPPGAMPAGTAVATTPTGGNGGPVEPVVSPPLTPSTRPEPSPTPPLEAPAMPQAGQGG